MLINHHLSEEVLAQPMHKLLGLTPISTIWADARQQMHEIGLELCMRFSGESSLG